MKEIKAHVEITYMMPDDASDEEVYERLHSRVSWHCGVVTIRRVFEVGRTPHTEIDVEAIQRNAEGKGPRDADAD